MSKFLFKYKPLVAAAMALAGAPAAGAVIHASVPQGQVAASSGTERTLRIELVLPKEPEVHALYPLEAFDRPPVNEFKGRPARGGAWRVGFDFDFGATEMRAEPPGGWVALEAEARREKARFEQARDDYLQAERERAALVLAEVDRRTAAAPEPGGPQPWEWRSDPYPEP